MIVTEKIDKLEIDKLASEYSITYHNQYSNIHLKVPDGLLLMDDIAIAFKSGFLKKIEKNMAVTIITPDEVRKSRVDYIPEVVFEAFNKLITSNFDGQSSTVYQDDVLAEICNEETGLNKEMVFKKHYLDVEDFYRKKGWKVEYDKPAYYENYRAYFKFTAVN